MKYSELPGIQTYLLNIARGFDAAVCARMDTKTAGGKQLGYDKLRPKQIEAMSSFIEGNDVFVSLPTGYGKSIIYAALPYAFDKLNLALQLPFKDTKFYKVHLLVKITR